MKLLPLFVAGVAVFIAAGSVNAQQPQANGETFQQLMQGLSEATAKEEKQKTMRKAEGGENPLAHRVAFQKTLCQAVAERLTGLRHGTPTNESLMLLNYHNEKCDPVQLLQQLDIPEARTWQR